FGSYLVFRKLEQRVASFLATEQGLATALGLLGADRERAGAMAVGRFRNGTPLALCPAPPPGNVKAHNFNDFNYFKEAETGASCPLHAHIRRLNPRTTSHVAMAGERGHRIVRRSIPYGRRQGQDENPPTLKDAPDTGVGMLFMSFQANIADQFAFLQKVWANDTQKPEEARDGIDPLIGQAKGRPTKQLWSPRRCGKPNTAFDFAGHVGLLGGEFFFAPSIPFLLNPPA
ncbi:MAG TPA: peroxidase, partial [Thermoanaerobaculia bacterium]|nr:peroxidase [Thermoanaerobaculia bacterium]